MPKEDLYAELDESDRKQGRTPPADVVLTVEEKFLQRYTNLALTQMENFRSGYLDRKVEELTQKLSNHLAENPGAEEEFQQLRTNFSQVTEDEKQVIHPKLYRLPINSLQRQLENAIKARNVAKKEYEEASELARTEGLDFDALLDRKKEEHHANLRTNIVQQSQ